MYRVASHPTTKTRLQRARRWVNYAIWRTGNLASADLTPHSAAVSRRAEPRAVIHVTCTNFLALLLRSGIRSLPALQRTWDRESAKKGGIVGAMRQALLILGVQQHLTSWELARTPPGQPTLKPLQRPLGQLEHTRNERFLRAMGLRDIHATQRKRPRAGFEHRAIDFLGAIRVRQSLKLRADLEVALVDVQNGDAVIDARAVAPLQGCALGLR